LRTNSSLRDEYGFVDLNRTGQALMEIITRPDIHSPEEAAANPARAGCICARLRSSCLLKPRPDM